MYDFNQGKYNLKENEVINLATTRLIVEFSTSKELVYQMLQQNIEKYVPSKFLSLNPSMYWIQKIMESYGTLVNKLNTKTSAQMSFIDQLKSNHLWEVQQFKIKVSDIFMYSSRKNTIIIFMEISLKI